MFRATTVGDSPRAAARDTVQSACARPAMTHQKHHVPAVVVSMPWSFFDAMVSALWLSRLDSCV